MKSPFPYFGGKAKAASLVWNYFGDVANYVEPFFGSGAVLLNRPTEPQIETINDADGLLANFWRAIRFDPEAVAEYADQPIHECDLHARHSWLVGQRERITAKLEGDPEWFDAKAAGWWVWGISLWIGSGWCSGKGSWIVADGELVNFRQLPHLGNAGQGINRQLPHLGSAGQGINRKLPHLGDAGQGINRQLPHLGNAGRGINRKRQELQVYFQQISDRLRNVRVCCGDWTRVTGPSVTFKHGITGVFLDPPYADTANRAEGLYAKDCLQVAHQVREWAIANGNNPELRIALCGYEGEHEMPDSWIAETWNTGGGYDGQSKDADTIGKNRAKERIWFSPHCLSQAMPLFSLVEAA